MDRIHEFGSWMKARRKTLDLTQAALAQKVGCAEVTIKQIESGARRPSRQIAELLATSLEIPASDRDAFIRIARTPQTNTSPAALPDEEVHMRRQLPSAVERSAPRQELPGSGAAPSDYPLIGRAAEWQTLHTAWRTVLQTGAHLVVIGGEAGIGKSRLAEEVSTWVSHQGVNTAHSRAYAAEGALAYAPIAEWLRTDAMQPGWQALDSIWLTEIGRILPELAGEQPRPEPLSESWRRKRLFEALARAVLAHDRPLLLVLDDLQWCDRETLEWLHYLLRYDRGAPLLLIGTVRSEEVTSEHPLTVLLLDLRSTEQVTEIELNPLNIDETAALAAQVVGYSLAPDVEQRLFGQTEGNPLFVVETLRADLSRGMGAMGGQESSFSLTPLPPKLQAVIQWRLAQLSPKARELVSLAAVIGRSFTFQLLAQASDLAEDALMRVLDELWQRRLVRELGTDAYDFSHDRIREVAEAAIGKAQHRLLHRRAAQALEVVHSANLDAVSGQLAGHYERAALLEQAILYYRRAGEIAYQLYANEEAINYWTKSLELLKTLPASAEHMQQQLDLLLVLGPALIAARDYIAPEVEEVYRQAQVLSHQVGDTSRIFTALLGSALSYSAQGNVRVSRNLSEKCLMLAQELDDPVLLMAAHAMLGEGLCYLGEFSLAKVHLEQAISYYDPPQQASRPRIFGGQDLAISNLSTLSICLWFLGYIDRGLQRSREVFVRGQHLADPFNRGLAIGCSSMHHALRQDWKVTLAHVEVANAIATQWNLGALVAWPLQGWALAKEGHIAEGIALLQQSLVEVHIFTPMFRAALAEAYGRVGRVDEGLLLIAETLSLAQSTGMVYWNTELLRLQGELLMVQGADEQVVESCYMQAIQIACEQSAKSLELRAVMSLARLWQKQGKQNEAYQRLSAIYTWFSEGFDSPELIEAKAFLDQG